MVRPKPISGCGRRSFAISCASTLRLLARRARRRRTPCGQVGAVQPRSAARSSQRFWSAFVARATCGRPRRRAGDRCRVRAARRARWLRARRAPRARKASRSAMRGPPEAAEDIATLPPCASSSPARAASAPASTAPSRSSSARSRATAPPVYVRHEIVHNRHVVDALRAKGAVFVEDPREVPPGSLLVFSAHGVSPAVRAGGRGAGAARRSTRPARSSRRSTSRRSASPAGGHEIVLVGHAGHVEVEGTMGHAAGRIRLVETRRGRGGAARGRRSDAPRGASPRRRSRSTTRAR